MRRREISPEFWVDERVVEVSDGAKLLFIGLWNIADREGRLEDKARTIALKVRPWDPAPVVGLLEELVAQGMVRRYEVDGVRCLHIPRFTEHQNVHPKEMASKLPAPPAHGAMHVQPAATVDAVERLEVSRPAVERTKISPFPSGSSGSSFPSGSSGLREQVALPIEPKVEKPKPPKPAKQTDPRHAPLVARLVEAFADDRETAYPFGPRDAKVVSNLLARAEPDVIVAAWERALRHQGYPTVATLAQLEQHLAQFVGASRADTTKGYAQPSVFTETKDVTF